MNESKTLFYLHIHKTAGKSLITWMERQFAVDQVCKARQPEALADLTKSERAGRRLFMGHFPGDMNHFLGRDLAQFTVLREPIARAVSHYSQMYRVSAYHLYARAQQLRTFSACLRDPYIVNHFRNYQARFLAYDGLPRRGIDIEWTESDAKLLDAAKRRLDRMACVGTMERFSDTVELIAHTFDFDIPTKLPRVNITPNYADLPPITQEDLEQVAEMNGVDAALHAYADGLLSAQLAAMRAHRRDHPLVWAARQERERLKAMAQPPPPAGVRRKLEALADRLAPKGSRRRSVLRPFVPAIRFLLRRRKSSAV